MRKEEVGVMRGVVVKVSGRETRGSEGKSERCRKLGNIRVGK